MATLIYYIQQTCRLQYRLILPSTAVYYCHFTHLFINMYVKCSFPSSIHSLYFYSFKIYFIPSLYIYIIILPFYRSSFLSSFFYIFHSLPPPSLTISNPAVAACAVVLLVWMGYSRHYRWNDTARLSAHYSPWFMKQFDAT